MSEPAIAPKLVAWPWVLESQTLPGWGGKGRLGAGRVRERSRLAFCETLMCSGSLLLGVHSFRILWAEQGATARGFALGFYAKDHLPKSLTNQLRPNREADFELWARVRRRTDEWFTKRLEAEERPGGGGGAEARHPSADEAKSSGCGVECLEQLVHESETEEPEQTQGDCDDDDVELSVSEFDHARDEKRHQVCIVSLCLRAKMGDVQRSNELRTMVRVGRALFVITCSEDQFDQSAAPTVRTEEGDGARKSYEGTEQESAETALLRGRGGKWEPDQKSENARAKEARRGEQLAVALLREAARSRGKADESEKAAQRSRSQKSERKSDSVLCTELR